MEETSKLIKCTDPTTECTPYSYAPVAAAVAGGQFPPHLAARCERPRERYGREGEVPGDERERAGDFAEGACDSAFLFCFLPDGSLTRAQGTMVGDFSNFTPSYPTTDPDRWWTYHQCVTPKVGNLSADVAR
jgi:hypothetical protein